MIFAGIVVNFFQLVTATGASASVNTTLAQKELDQPKIRQSRTFFGPILGFLIGASLAADVLALDDYINPYDYLSGSVHLSQDAPSHWYPIMRPTESISAVADNSWWQPVLSSPIEEQQSPLFVGSYPFPGSQSISVQENNNLDDSEDNYADASNVNVQKRRLAVKKNSTKATTTTSPSSPASNKRRYNIANNNGSKRRINNSHDKILQHRRRKVVAKKPTTSTTSTTPIIITTNAVYDYLTDYYDDYDTTTARSTTTRKPIKRSRPDARPKRRSTTSSTTSTTSTTTEGNLYEYEYAENVDYLKRPEGVEFEQQIDSENAEEKTEEIVTTSLPTTDETSPKAQQSTTPLSTTASTVPPTITTLAPTTTTTTTPAPTTITTMATTTTTTTTASPTTTTTKVPTTTPDPPTTVKITTLRVNPTTSPQMVIPTTPTITTELNTETTTTELVTETTEFITENSTEIFSGYPYGNGSSNGTDHISITYSPAESSSDLYPSFTENNGYPNYFLYRDSVIKNVNRVVQSDDYYNKYYNKFYNYYYDTNSNYVN